jgi:hypothetical protein
MRNLNIYHLIKKLFCKLTEHDLSSEETTGALNDKYITETCRRCDHVSLTIINSGTGFKPITENKGGETK